MCFRSGSPIHQDVVSVLAAVVETIKQAGGQETELEYLAALTTTLIGVKDQPNLVAATAFLLKLVLKKIPVHVLQSKFGQVFIELLLLHSFLKLFLAVGSFIPNFDSICNL